MLQLTPQSRIFLNVARSPAPNTTTTTETRLTRA